MSVGSIRKSVIVLVLGFIAVFVQGTLLRGSFPSMVVPDLVCILVVFLSFYEPGLLGAFLAFLVGLQFDLASGVLLGPRAGSSVAVFGFLSSLSQRIFVESGTAMMFAVFISTIVNFAVYMILVVEFRHTQEVVVSDFFRLSVLGEATLSALITPLIFLVLRRLFSARPTSGGSANLSGLSRSAR